MSSFDDDPDLMPETQFSRRPAARPQHDEDDDEAGGEQITHSGGQLNNRPPMKSWGDSSTTTTTSTSSFAQSAAVDSISEDVSDTSGGGAAVDKEKPGFGRRATTNQRGGGAPMQSSRDKYDTDVITDITEIPDLDADPSDAPLTQVADAPNVLARRVQGLQELDDMILYKLPTGGNGVDLSVLIAALSPQENVVEPDAVWEFDQMFADISSEMMAEMEPPEKEEGEEGEEAADDAQKKEPASP